MKNKGLLSTSNYEDSIQRILVPSILVLASLVIGTLGYFFIEKLSIIDSVYLTTATMFLATGYLNGLNLSAAGKLFSMVFLIIGVFSVFYAVGTIIEFIVEGNIKGIRRKRKMDKTLSEIKGHYIISGFGRVGHQIAAQLEAEKIPYVIIDMKHDTAEELEPKGVPFIIGNVSSDEVLEKEGIKRAKCLIAAADSDVENVYVTLTAKDLNPGITVVARASHKYTESKLRKAGADRVISPYFIAGSRMASMAVNPVSSEFLDIVTGSDNIELWLKEVKVKERSQLADKTLGEAKVRQVSGAMVLTIKKSNGSYDLSPRAESRMEIGDIVVALGTNQQLDILAKMA